MKERYERQPFKMLVARRAAGHFYECRRKINALDESVAHCASGGICLGRGVINNQWHLHRRLMEQVFLAEPVIAHIVAMVRCDGDHGILQLASVAQVIEQHAHLVVDLLD